MQTNQKRIIDLIEQLHSNIVTSFTTAGSEAKPK